MRLTNRPLNISNLLGTGNCEGILIPAPQKGCNFVVG